MKYMEKETIIKRAIDEIWGSIEEREVSVMRRKKKIMRHSNRNNFVVITLAVLFLCGVLTYKTISLSEQTAKYQATIDEYQKDMDKLEQEKEDIAELKEYVESDRYIEEMAREKLGLVYEDEVIFEADDED